jgi:quercetin 2,3-dioxygenase
MGVSTAGSTGVDIRRAHERMRTRTAWLDSRHSFSFGSHYEPTNTHFGLLMANNDDLVTAGGGFDTHPHRDMEIVTWVLEGALAHQDSAGNSGVVHPGLAQRMSAGSGILHSERNDSPHGAPVRFVQMWVLPDAVGGPPGYEQLDIASALRSGERLVVASGRPEHADTRAVSLRQRHAALHAARLRPAGTTELPVAPLVHLFVAGGAAELEGTGRLDAGDAARVTGGAGQRVTACRDGAEALVWEMHAALG